jgi:lysophospholipase L1-like esterase
VAAWLLALLLALFAPPLVQPADPTLRIAVVGDSISCGGQAGTDGWCPELSRLLNAVGVDHELLPLAVGGTRCDYWADHVGDVLMEHEPDLVILGCGTNDGAAQLPAAEVQAAVESVADQVDAAGAQLLTGIPSYSSGQPTGRLWLPAAQHEAYAGIRATGLTPMFDDTAMPPLTRFQVGDGVHPTAEGYKVLAHNRYRALAAFLPGLPAIPPDCMQIGHAPGDPRPRGIPCYGRPGV